MMIIMHKNVIKCSSRTYSGEYDPFAVRGLNYLRPEVDILGFWSSQTRKGFVVLGNVSSK